MKYEHLDNIRTESESQSDSVLAVDAENLVRTFGSTRAVDGIDLKIKRGIVYGLLGPNGAGKTTVVRMLSTLLRPTSGTAKVFGFDIVHQADEVRNHISLTGQFASVDEDLTGSENLVMLALLWGYKRKEAKLRADGLLGAFDLHNASGRQVKTYSGGMRRRLDIAASIVVLPELIFLDEPTTGLDPRSRKQVWDIIRALVSFGTTVVLTTQNLDEADRLADRIAVIDTGKIIAEGTSEELKALVGKGRLHLRLVFPEQRDRAMQVLSHNLGISAVKEDDPSAAGAHISDIETAAEVLRTLSSENIPVSSFSFGRPSLDEVFLTLTGRNNEEVESL